MLNDLAVFVVTLGVVVWGSGVVAGTGAGADGAVKAG